MAALTSMLDVTYSIPSWIAQQNQSQPQLPSNDGDGSAPHENFNVLIIGAGAITFGSKEGPWNHSYRLESKLGPRLKVVGLVDPFVERSQAVLTKKRASFVASAYENTVTYKSVDDFAANAKADQKPRLIIVGTPAAFRGSDEPGRDLEIQLLKLFPDVALFIEKPVAIGAVEKTFAVANLLEKSPSPCSVGYMLRYLKAVQAMKKIIKDNNLTVMATIARYAAAYEGIDKPDWWNKAMSCGPVVEQGTHFCDLSRYFGGDVEISTVQASALEWDEPAGHLSKIPIDESKVSPENRIPRVSAANWKYKNGAIGVLTHLATLQGTSYACELEVYCDGYLLKLIDPYNTPILHVRKPGSDIDEVIRFEEDDPFFSEISTIVDIVEKGPSAAEILSSYRDACKTYELTWAIRLASEKKSYGK